MKILLFSLIAALVTGCKGQVAVARFRDAAYHVVEGEKIFSVVVEKIGSSTRVLTAFIRYNRGTATPPSDYPSIPQTAQIVRLPRHSSAQITANLTVDDDTVLECNETFTLTLESFSSEDLLTIDPAGNQTVVTIIDDDEGTVVFSGSRSIMEGTTGFITVSILQSISQSFTVTVESYECTRDDIFAATPGEDYVPVNNTILTFTETTTFHRIDIVTLQDTRYEGDGESEILCLRIFNLVEPCLSYVSVGADVQVLIEDDDTPNFTIFCHTVASGNSLTGWTIDLFYSTFRFFDRFTAFRCALNDATLSGCPGPSPAPYGPLSYANHTVTIEGISVFGTQKITHQILIVLGRLRLYNSSAIQLSIQSTKNSTYECRLNNVKDGRYFTCNDDDIIAGLPPNTYNLTVRATSTDDSYQTAIDVAGPITLTGGSAVATCSGGVNLVTMDVSASTYRARWRARGERIVFELAGRGQGWVGIGFSYNRIQTQSDIVLGAADETGYFVDDRFAFVTEQTTPPPHDATQNVKDTFASFENGVTTVKFSRVRNTGDVNDYSLSDCIFFLYAWGGEVFNITTGAIAYHGINRRFVSDSLVCIPISQTFCPEQFDCDPPPTPGNGSVTYDNMLEGSVANYSCNNGFRLVGDDQTVCQANATWSGAVPICIVDCGDLDAPENGDVVYDETLEGYVASYSCNFGYRLDGDDQRVCQTDSIWSGVVPSCIHIDCGSPGTVVNGTVDSNGTYLTSVATFTCDIGFHLFGDRQRICQLDGTWSNMVPGCSHCGFPDVPSNGDGAVISTTLGSIVVYTCSDTYALCGDKTRTCLSNRMWSGSVPNCTRAVATVDFTSYTVDEDASSTVIGILLDQPNCVNVIIVLTPQEQSPVDASTLDFNSNPILVTIIAGDTSGTATIPITNDSIVEGNESFDTVLTTNSRGVIIGTPGQADVTIVDDEDSIDCGDPGKPANGTANYTDTLVGSVVTYDCDFATCTSDSPFALCGNSSRTCLPTGMWSGSIPECIKSLVTIKRTEYTAKESDGFVDVTILVDTPNCKPITVIVQPKEQTPVDASVADFDDSPIIITIVPGDTDATVSIPITNDTILESDEKFDIVIDASGIGVALGYPKQAEVTIAAPPTTIPPTITVPPKPTVDIAPYSASFSCSAKGMGNVKISWRREDGQALPTNAVTAVQDSGNDEMTTTGFLIISDITAYDMGKYCCVASNEAGEVVSDCAQLTVQIPPPVIKEHPQDVNVPQGTAVTFNCEATSYGDTTYLWQRVDGGKLDLSRVTGVNGNKLTISNPVPDDTGSYVCIASNKDGKTVSRNANLNVEAQCPTNLSIDNGYVMFSVDNKLVAYRCFIGFRLIGSSSAECMQDGTWSSSPPECTVDSCTNIAATNCAHFTNVDDQGNVLCMCRPGYRVDLSNSSNCIDIDECKLDDSLCDKECVNTEGSYYCRCPASYALATNGTSCIECGTSKSTNGNSHHYVTRKRFNWHVQLCNTSAASDDENVLCSGSLINDQWVLTSAECVCEGQDHSELIVNVHKTGNCSKPLNNGTSHTIAAVRCHEGYKSKVVGYNVALLKLSSPVNAIPVCLPKNSISVNFHRNVNDVTMTGWGYSPILKYSEFPTVPDLNCKKSYGGRYNVSFNSICTDEHMRNGHCDNGSPMMYRVKSLLSSHHWFVLVGIANEDCQATQPYDVYTSITGIGIYDWITKTTGLHI